MYNFFKTIATIALLGVLITTGNAYAGDPDINDDGEVNILDVSLVSSCLFQDPLAPTNPTCSNADPDEDNDIDFDDLYFVYGHYGETGFPIPFVIAGTDADNNGIWDYVDGFIDNKYPDPSDKKIAAQRTAITFQQFLIDADDQVKTLENNEALSRSIACLFYVNNEPDDALITDELEAIIVNTEERNNAYLTATDKLSGYRTKSISLSEACPDLSEAEEL